MTSDPLYDPDQSWQWTPAGGESLDDVRNRAIAALSAVRARHRGKDIVIVCHVAVIQAICAHIGGEWSESRVPTNCGVVELIYTPEGWRLSNRAYFKQSEGVAILTATQPKA